MTVGPPIVDLRDFQGRKHCILDSLMSAAVSKGEASRLSTQDFSQVALPWHARVHGKYISSLCTSKPSILCTYLLLCKLTSKDLQNDPDWELMCSEFRLRCSLSVCPGWML